MNELHKLDLDLVFVEDQISQFWCMSFTRVDNYSKLEIKLKAHEICWCLQQNKTICTHAEFWVCLFSHGFSQTKKSWMLSWFVFFKVSVLISLNSSKQFCKLNFDKSSDASWCVSIASVSIAEYQTVLSVFNHTDVSDNCWVIATIFLWALLSICSFLLCMLNTWYMSLVRFAIYADERL